MMASIKVTFYQWCHVYNLVLCFQSMLYSIMIMKIADPSELVTQQVYFHMVPLKLRDNLHFIVMKPGLMAFLTSHMIRSAMNAETALYVGTPISTIANTHDICQGSLVSPVPKDRDFMKVILLYPPRRLHSVITHTIRILSSPENSRNLPTYIANVRACVPFQLVSNNVAVQRFIHSHTF